MKMKNQNEGSIKIRKDVQNRAVYTLHDKSYSIKKHHYGYQVQKIIQYHKENNKMDEWYGVFDRAVPMCIAG